MLVVLFPDLQITKAQCVCDVLCEDLWFLRPFASWNLNWRKDVGLTLVFAGVPLRFGEGAQVDWWLLLLSGPGTFETAEDGWKECADISTLLPSLPGAQLAPCFGHAWLPANRINEIPESVQLMGGLQRRVREALDVLGARPVRQFHWKR